MTPHRRHLLTLDHVRRDPAAVELKLFKKNGIPYYNRLRAYLQTLAGLGTVEYVYGRCFIVPGKPFADVLLGTADMCVDQPCARGIDVKKWSLCGHHYRARRREGTMSELANSEARSK